MKRRDGIAAGSSSAEWPLVLLDGIALRGSGHTPSKKRPGYWGGDIQWVSLADTGALDKGVVTHTANTITTDGVAHSAAVVHPSGTVILLRGSSVGKSAVLGADMAVSQDYVSWTCGPRIDNWYLYYVLQSRKSEFARIAFGNTIKTIGLDYFRHLTVPLPPIREQQELVRILAAADKLVSSLQQVIAKKRAIKQGMMQQLLTGKTRLPGFTEPWREVQLGDHVTYIKTVALSRAQLDTTSPLRYLHYGDIHTRFATMLNAGQEAMPRAASALARNAGRLQPGDLVFADASEDPDGVGKSVEITAVPSDGVVPGLHTIAARFDKDVLVDGFKAYLQFIPAFRKSLLRLVAGTKVLATTRSYISGITLPLPGVDEQRAIATVLRDCDSEIEALSVCVSKVSALKQGMMQQLLTDRTRLPVAEAL
jgi:type I restriction enzyme S subunit